MKAIVSVILSVVISMVKGFVGGAIVTAMLMCAATCCHAAEPVLKGKTIVTVKSDQPSKPKAVATGYSIEVKGKVYPIFKGPRGGYFYIKNDKPVYLTAAQRALIK